MGNNNTVNEKDVQKNGDISCEFQETINKSVYQPILGEPEDPHKKTHHSSQDDATYGDQQCIQDTDDGGS